MADEGDENPDGDNMDGGDEGGDETNDGGVRGMCCGVCVAPWIVLISLILIGWNEKRAVCDAKALDAGHAEAVDAGCSGSSASDSNGKLVFYNCKLDEPTEVIKGFDSFSGVSHKGYCLMTKGEMYQCKETKKTSSSRRRSSTRTTYTHELGWFDEEFKSADFTGKDSDTWRDVCRGKENDPWPVGAPKGTTITYAKTATAGDSTWLLTDGDLQMIGLNCGAVEAATAPIVPDYKAYSRGVYEKKDNANPNAIGDYRVTIAGDKAAGSWIVGLGKNKDGKLEAWTAPDDWLCAGYTVSGFQTGQMTKDEYFEGAKSGNTIVTWICRIAFFGFLWGGWICLVKPFADMLDFIPCIGDYLESMVQAILPIVTCPPACACCLLVAGTVWIVMRPMLAIPLMLLGFCSCGVAVYSAVTAQQNKGKKKQLQEEQPKDSE